jgi:cobalt-zinc-cadmium efflux system outer membrane protein
MWARWQRSALAAAALLGCLAGGCVPLRQVTPRTSAHSAVSNATAEFAESRGGNTSASPYASPRQVTPRTSAHSAVQIATAEFAESRGANAPIAQIVFSKPAALDLDELIELAARNNPDLAVAQAQADAARGRLVQAGLYPNPSLGPRFNDLNSPRDSIGAPGFSMNQEFVLGKKLQLATAAAAQGVAAADWAAITRWYDVITRVRQAYYDVLTAEREVQTNREIVELSQKSLDVIEKLLKKVSTKLDVLRAQVELEQNRTRFVVAEKRLQASWRLLARAVGLSELPANEVTGNLEVRAPVYDWAPLLETTLVRSSEIQEAHALQMQADGLLRRAQAEPIPNMQLQVQPSYAVPIKNMFVEVTAVFAIPVFDRNQGNIAAARAEVARTHAQIRQVELRLTEQLTLAYQRYQVAQQQVAAFRDKIVPNANESFRLVQLAFERGDGKTDYTSVLQAQQIVVQTRLQYVQALGELWRAVSEIRGIVQD